MGYQFPLRRLTRMKCFSYMFISYMCSHEFSDVGVLVASRFDGIYKLKMPSSLRRIILIRCFQLPGGRKRRRRSSRATAWHPPSLVHRDHRAIRHHDVEAVHIDSTTYTISYCGVDVGLPSYSASFGKPRGVECLRKQMPVSRGPRESLLSEPVKKRAGANRGPCISASLLYLDAENLVTFWHLPNRSKTALLGTIKSFIFARILGSSRYRKMPNHCRLEEWSIISTALSRTFPSEN